MANKQINEFTNGGAVISTESFITQTVGNLTQRHTAAQIKTFANQLNTPVLGESNVQDALLALEAAAGGGSKEYEFIVNFATTPLTSGSSTLITTTLPLKSILKETDIQVLTTITSTPDGADPVELQIGLETDDETLSSIPILTGGGQYVRSAETAIVNRSLKITAIDGSITGGTISLIVIRR